MCGGGGPGGGSGDPGGVGEAGSPAGSSSGNASGGTGGEGGGGTGGAFGNTPGGSQGNVGNIGPGISGLIGNSDLGVSTAGELGVADAGMGIGSSPGPSGVGAGGESIAPSLFGGWAEATTTTQGEDPALSGDNPSGFSAMQGGKYGGLIGLALGGLPVGLIGGLVGAMASQAQGDPSGGSPIGGGPSWQPGEPGDPGVIPSYPKPPGWGEGGAAGNEYFFGNSVTGIGGGGAGGSPGGGAVTDPFKFTGDDGLSMYKMRKLTEDKDVLGDDYIKELNKFTKTIF